MLTIYKCYGVLIQHEDKVPDENSGFVADLIAGFPLDRYNPSDPGLLDLILSGAAWSAYHAYSYAQPTVFGLLLECYEVNMRDILKIVDGSAQKLEDKDHYNIKRWMDGPAAPYLNLLEKHGKSLGLCWLVGTN